MKNYNFGSANRIIREVRDFCSRHNIIVGTDCSRFSAEGIFYCVFYYAGWERSDTFMVAVNMDGVLSIDDCINIIIDNIRSKLKTGFASPFSTLGHVDYELFNDRCPSIKNVIFNDPATIVFWKDGSKTVVKAQDGETYDPEKGLAMAISKKALGNTAKYYNEFKKWLPDDKDNDILINPYMQALLRCFLGNGRPQEAAEPTNDLTINFNGKKPYWQEKVKSPKDFEGSAAKPCDISVKRKDGIK